VPFLPLELKTDVQIVTLSFASTSLLQKASVERKDILRKLMKGKEKNLVIPVKAVPHTIAMISI
jgi:hypothetical protein